MPDEYKNQIVTGDALELLESVPPMSVDLIVTDPPYMLGAASSYKSKRLKVNPWADLMNASYWFAEWYKKALRCLKPAGALWTFLNWRSLPTVTKASIMAGAGVNSLLVWNKDWIGPGGSVGLRPSYELVALIPKSEFAIENRGHPDIQTFKWSSRKPTGHPAEKPVPLFRWLIEISIRPRGVVLDPFIGSGTCALAAANHECGWVGFEIDPETAQKARERVRNTQPPLFLTDPQQRGRGL